MKKQFTYILSLLLTFSLQAISQCPYDNLLYETHQAPGTVGATIVIDTSWGGDLDRILGMQAGYTYEISTCNTPTFDSEITIYPAGGGTYVAYDDDGCGSQGGPSKLQFTPAATGDYDILLDEWQCSDNNTNMNLEIKLISTGSVNPGSLVIPVVVHVVYNSSVENVSDNQINSQIAALNRDYRKQNADFNTAPGVFQPLGADMDISFCLASYDPQGNPTTGITRTQTSISGFSQTTHPKSTANGGHDNWNPHKYLNLWVCDLSGTLLGFATFPTDLSTDPNLDGVVIDYQYFGTTGTSTAPFDLGRTATHEVGHWLNLKHIWGDANCGDDLVNDTPTQQGPNSQCPNFPHTTCQNGNNGDLFYDYMDYTDDACMVMFTHGQKTRANGAIASFRGGLASSIGCVVGIDELNKTSSFQVYPNPSNDVVTVAVSGSNNQDYTLKLFNMIGEEVRMFTATYRGNNNFEFSVKDLAKGIYSFQLNNQETLLTRKFVVQ